MQLSPTLWILIIGCPIVVLYAWKFFREELGFNLGWTIVLIAIIGYTMGTAAKAIELYIVGS